MSHLSFQHYCTAPSYGHLCRLHSRDACALHAGCLQDACSLLHPAYRSMQAAYGRLHTGVIRATCRLHLEKYNLHFENAIDMKPACRLHVALSVATSIEKQLSIPGVDALLQDAASCSRASTACRLHAACMQSVDDALN